jgi:hypothetical protein
MKLKPIKTLGLGAAILVALAPAVKADLITYTWVQGSPSTSPLLSQLPHVVNSSVTTSGSLVYNSSTGTIQSYGFTVSGSFNFFDTIVLPAGPGESTILPDGHLLVSTPSAFGDTVFSGSAPNVFDGHWYDNLPTQYGQPNENVFYVSTPSGATITGDWVAVPEASTMASGMLLLLPFAVSAVRIFRKNSFT